MIKVIKKNFEGGLIYEVISCHDVTDILTPRQVENLKTYGKTVISDQIVKQMKTYQLNEELKKLTGFSCSVIHTDDGYIVERNNKEVYKNDL